MTAAAPRRPRILAIAEAANPDWVSVPLVGWSLAHSLRAVAEVHLVTQVRNRAAILAAGYVEGRDFTAIDSEALARPAYRLADRLRGDAGKGWTILQAANALSYPYFEHLVWRRFGDALRAGEYDIVHRITPLSPTVQSPLAPRLAKIGVPFVLGPLNGGVPWPEGYEAARRAEREWLAPLRAAYKLLPGRRATLTHASAILAGSRHTASEMPARCADKVLWLPENGIAPERFSRRAQPGQGRPLRVAFVGRLVPYKGCDMLIDAARPLIEAGQVALDIVGDGPEMDRLRGMAGELGSGVLFHGWQPHARVQDILAGADLLGFPSIREFGGGVVLEAMALGLPPLVVDYAGPGELVDDAVGFTIPCLPPDALVPALRAALGEIVAQPFSLRAKGAAAAARVEAHFTWQAKAAQVARVYEWVLQGAPRPAPDLFADDPVAGARPA
ncbi:Glycosyltransferase involved in cell wall bisynthesis [Roseivivax lentus]|uniref:Glycosyltransferase involved in cell wall bisynthesis n=1 Tax=Roseivivax lentus TaxID=633194 RepID=A0A1N7JWB5_9RHOB|nr:glycosyltransferase family 4 protein [Roseivivax lentus]SIS53617.1 Glycosyltransferase involved in cell wall bisynthesis [Roseivivax lentus]